ncbi:hypothetical protein, partial [Eggerthella hominis]
MTNNFDPPEEMGFVLESALLRSVADRTLVCGTVGLGYVGLPLAVEKAKAGFKTIGFDVQAD